MDVIQELEEDIGKAQKIIEMGNALGRLLNDRDFKKVVMHGYFENEAVRLVHLKADPNQQSAEAQDSIVKQMDSIGNLNRYFRNIDYQRDLAVKATNDAEIAREEILKESLQ